MTSATLDILPDGAAGGLGDSVDLGSATLALIGAVVGEGDILVCISQLGWELSSVLPRVQEGRADRGSRS